MWEAVKTFLTFASVVVAGLALAQSQSTSEKQAQLAEQQADLSRQALSIQSKTFDRTQAMLTLTDIKVELDGPNDVLNSYPQSSQTQTITIPKSEWAAATGRYVRFSIANPGDSSIFISEIGIGANASQYRQPKPGSKWCMSKDDKTNWVDCPREIMRSTENRYAVSLNQDNLTSVEQIWQKDGLEICVKIEAYSIVCRRSWAALPDGFMDAFSSGPPR